MIPFFDLMRSDIFCEFFFCHVFLYIGQKVTPVDRTESIISSAVGFQQFTYVFPVCHRTKIRTLHHLLRPFTHRN